MKYYCYYYALLDEKKPQEDRENRGRQRKTERKGEKRDVREKKQELEKKLKNLLLPYADPDKTDEGTEAQI